TIQALSCRDWSHVCDEILKRVTPTIANGYSAPTIEFIRPARLAITSVFHTDPDTILFSRISHCRNVFFSLRSFRMSMGSFCFLQPFTMKAAARFGLFIERHLLSFAKILDAHPFYRSTIAKTLPICPAR